MKWWGWTPAYKDALALPEALETRRFNVAVSDFESRNRDRDVALELRSGIQNGLLRFLRPLHRRGRPDPP